MVCEKVESWKETVEDMSYTVSWVGSWEALKADFIQQIFKCYWRFSFLFFASKKGCDGQRCLCLQELFPWPGILLPWIPSETCPDPCPPKTSTHQHPPHPSVYASSSWHLLLYGRFLAILRAGTPGLGCAWPVAGGHVDSTIPHVAASTATHRSWESRWCVPPIGRGHH